MVQGYSLPYCEYHDFLVSVASDDLGVTVGLTGVVDEPRLVARHRSIHYIITVDAKHVTANALQENKSHDHYQVGDTSNAPEEVGRASSQITCSHLKWNLFEPAESAHIFVPRLFSLLS